MVEEKKKAGRPQGTTIYTPEENYILYKCKSTEKGREIYPTVKQLLKSSIQDLNKSKDNFNAKLREINNTKFEDWKEKDDKLQVYRTLHKQANRIISLRMLEKVDDYELVKKYPDKGVPERRLKELRRKPVINTETLEWTIKEELTDEEELELIELIRWERINHEMTQRDPTFAFEEDKIFEEPQEDKEETEIEVSEGYDTSDDDTKDEEEEVKGQEITIKYGYDEIQTVDINEFFASGKKKEKKERSRIDIYEDWYDYDISGSTDIDN